MEPEVQETPTFSRSELESAFDVSRSTGWMVVPSMPNSPRGYELWPSDGARVPSWPRGVSIALALSEDR
jgi:hypothetical protein